MNCIRLYSTQFGVLLLIDRFLFVALSLKAAYDAQGGGERACASLAEKLYLCLQDEIAEISAKGSRLMPVSGAASLCAGRNALFCADSTGAIWRFDAESMTERAIGCGGPGVCDMCLSDDGERLFSLLGEADSILMSDALSIRPLTVNRCGCNPQNISLCGNTLAVSGGESEYVYLFNAQTLECMAKIPMPGPVYRVFLAQDTIYALCLTEEFNTHFAICQKGNLRSIQLVGIPGCFGVCGEELLIATQRRLHVYSPADGRLLGRHSMPGIAARICLCWGKVFLLDAWSESVFVSHKDRIWRRIFTGVKGMFDCR